MFLFVELIQKSIDLKLKREKVSRENRFGSPQQAWDRKSNKSKA